MFKATGNSVNKGFQDIRAPVVILRYEFDPYLSFTILVYSLPTAGVKAIGLNFLRLDCSIEAEGLGINLITARFQSGGTDLVLQQQLNRSNKAGHIVLGTAYRLHSQHHPGKKGWACCDSSLSSLRLLQM